MVTEMKRYVVDAGVVLHLLERGIEMSNSQRLVAPTLIRSEVLEGLYRAVQAGDLDDAEGRDRLDRFARMKIRYLGDRVLRSVAWKVAKEMGWDSTHVAEYVALTQLRADAFVTLDADLEREVAAIVTVASIDVLV